MKRSTIILARSKTPASIVFVSANAKVDMGAGRDSAPQIDSIAYTGVAMNVAGHKHPVVIDLAGLAKVTKKRPLLKDHNPSEVVGHIEAASNDGRRLEVSGRMSGAGTAAKEAVESARRGFPWQASVGAVARDMEFVGRNQTVQVNGRTFQGPLLVARSSVLKEVSLVALGADDDTTVAIAAQIKEADMTFEAWVRARGFDPKKLTKKQAKTLRAAWQADIQATDDSAGTDGGDDAGDASDDDSDIDASDDGESDDADGDDAGDDAAPGGRRKKKIRASGAPKKAKRGAAGNANEGEDDDSDTSEDVNASSDEDESEDDQDVDSRIDRRISAERQRVAQIDRIAAGHPDIRNRAISAGWDRNRTELAVLRASRPDVNPRQGRGGPVRALVLQAALCMSGGISAEALANERGMTDQVIDAASSGEMRGFGIQALMHEVIRAAGMHVRPGHMNNDVIRSAFEANARLIRASGGGFSTISLTGILGNVANKSMLRAYEAVASVAPKIAAFTDASDFKQMTRYRLTAMGDFKKVGPDGELKHFTMKESSYTNQLDTRGAMVALPRQQIINDDLGAFLQIPTMLGRLSALSLEEALFTLLLSNPSNFFHANNKNYITGAGSVLSIPSVSAALQKFRDQVDANGKPILISPKILLVPSSLEVTAKQIYTDTNVNEAATAGTPQPSGNPHKAMFEPVPTPYLNNSAITGYSALAWYLLADPNDIAAMEVAFLRGQRRPTIEAGDTDFNTLGMQWRGFFDFGVGMGDPSAAVKTKGAA